MDIATHRVFQGFVDKTLALDRGSALEAGRNHHRPEVTAPVPRANVAGVEMTLIDDVDVNRG